MPQKPAMTMPMCDRACKHQRYEAHSTPHDGHVIYDSRRREVERHGSLFAVECRVGYLNGAEHARHESASRIAEMVMLSERWKSAHAHASASVKALREALAAMLGAARIGNDGYCALGCAASASAEIHGNGCPIDRARAALKETEGM